MSHVVLSLALMGLTASSDPAPDYGTVDEVIDGLYATVSFGPGEEPDWDHARSFFLPEAVVVFAERGSAPTQVMDLDGWIEDFQVFYRDRDLAEKGFQEGIAGKTITEYGNIAHAFVVFEPRVGPDFGGTTVPGLDSLELVRRDGRWWIAAITTQFSSEGLPIPAELVNRL